MNSKMLIGGVIGGVVIFLLGFLIYGILMADSMTGAPCMRDHDAVLLLWIALGNLFTGFLISYIYSKWASISTFGGGAMAGAILGLLGNLGSGCLMYGTTTMISGPSGILMEAVIGAIMWGIAGGAVGWWLGRK